jgi:glucose-6-phosphate isomerase
MAETIGKEFNKKKRKVYTGMTPLVSIGSIDLHSMVQLYLGGPYDKFVTFMQVEKEKSNVKLPKIKEYEELVPHIQGKGLKEIMNAIYKGTKLAFAKNHRPFCEITFPDKSEHSIGQFLQFKMMEIMYLSHLLEINPFDQPKVEDYKVETKRLLSGGKK